MQLPKMILTFNKRRKGKQMQLDGGGGVGKQGNRVRDQYRK